ncbi:heat shock protein 75 kDa, mitochondrial-like [Lineus longissimus]|uniref:heat shock protein 75 kDa, mitochondrial-like n=1 Tax=Lineus longissimus TaxID=88925 RepID=UPI00315DF0F9
MKMLSTRFSRLSTAFRRHPLSNYRQVGRQTASRSYGAIAGQTKPTLASRKYVLQEATRGRCLSRLFSTEVGPEKTEGQEEEDYHNIIKDTERSKGPSDKHEFQAETRKLLDIVAKSLYSEKEVFVREIISNASDSLEKMRYIQVTGADGEVPKDHPLEIHIRTDEEKKTFTIQDTGIGMTKEEMIENLGTIAKSGSQQFLDELSTTSDKEASSNIIGQFGVGFYSTFMVGDNVDVYSQSYKPGNKAQKWRSDGTGSYEIAEAEGVQQGTKIVVHLKGDAYDYAKEEIIKEVVEKYSNFVGVPIFLNGKRVNVIQPIWMMDAKDITAQQHDEFYRYLSGNAYGNPRYVVQYKADAPLNIRAVFYVPEQKPTVFDMSREIDTGISLYSRKIMIMSRATTILPKWMRFLRGVVDSEDIPLNLSRELLQNSALIRKLRDVLESRIIKFFTDQAKKDPEKYLKFHEDFGLFFREGIVTTGDQAKREDIAKLLRFESSNLPKGEVTSLEQYAERMKAGGRTIYYLSAPSRELAETSPYYEAMRKKDVEVLYCYESYDELVLMNLNQFDRKNLKSVESVVQEDKEDTGTVDAEDEQSLQQDDATTLMTWMGAVLGNKVNKTKITNRLESHPCIITVMEMGSVRHFLRTTLADKNEEERLRLLQPTLEINPKHVIIKKLNELRVSDPELAKLVLYQIYDNAMIQAGLLDDPRSMITRLNELLSKTLERVK